MCYCTLFSISDINLTKIKLHDLVHEGPEDLLVHLELGAESLVRRDLNPASLLLLLPIFADEGVGCCNHTIKFVWN